MSSRGTKFCYIIILSSLIFSSVALATETPLDWFSHQFGSTSVVAELFEGEKQTLLMDGVLKFSYPDGFQIQYHTLESPVSITSQKGFVEIASYGETEYGYDDFWLFNDLENYLFGLASFSQLDLEYSGPDQLVDRPVHRFISRSEPEITVWFDGESGLPLLVRKNKETLVKVVSYLLGPDGSEEMTSLELELLFRPEPAKLTLEKQKSWVPVFLEIEEDFSKVEVTFSNWEFPEEWIDAPFSRLEQIQNLNEVFLEQFADERWQQALSTSQELIGLAPQFWQAYLYQAFAYEALDNYLGVIENYQQVLMRNPDNHLALNNLAYHYFLREVQIQQGLEMAERAVSLERKDVYLDTLGYGYYLVGRYAEAKELLQEALLTAPDEAQPEISDHLNLVLEALGEKE